MTSQEFDVGAVAHDEHRAQFASLPRHRTGRDDQHTLADGGQRGRRITRAHDVQHPRCQTDLIDGMSGGGTDLKKSAGFVVDERGVAFGVDGQYAFADTVQHRLLGAHQFGHLRRLQIQCLLTPTPGQQAGEHDTGQQCGTARHGRGTLFVAQQAIHRRRGHTDADLTDDPGGIQRHHRYFRPNRRSQGSGLFHDLLASRQCGGRVGADRFTQLIGVGVAQPDPAVVGDHHEQHTGGQPDLGGDVLQRTALQLGGRRYVPVVGGDVGAHRRSRGQHPGDIERPVAVLVDQPVVIEHRQQKERDAQGEGHDRQLQQQDLRCEPQVNAALAGHSGSLTG